MAAGTVEMAIGQARAVQLLSIRDILQGKTVRVPVMYDSLSAGSAGRRKARGGGGCTPPEDLFRQRSLLLSFTDLSTVGVQRERVLPKRLRNIALGGRRGGV